MTRRPGFMVAVREPADGGESPNVYIPEITVEIRMFWPPRATRQEIDLALQLAHGRAVDRLEQMAPRTGTWPRVYRRRRRREAL